MCVICIINFIYRFRQFRSIQYFIPPKYVQTEYVDIINTIYIVEICNEWKYVNICDTAFTIIHILSYSVSIKYTIHKHI